MGTKAPVRRPARSASPRRFRLAAFLVVLCGAVAGCAAGFNAQTNQPYQAAEGINDRSNGIYVLNALVVADDQGNGTLVGTLINQSTVPDGLQSVTAAGANGQPIPTSKLANPIALDPQTAVKLQTGGAVRLTGGGVVAGDFITVTFTFDNAAAIVLEIPIVSNGPIYTGIPVGPT